MMAKIEANKTSIVECSRDCLYLKCGEFELSVALVGDSKIQIITDTNNGTFQGSVSYQELEDALVLMLLRQSENSGTISHDDVGKELGLIDNANPETEKA